MAGPKRPSPPAGEWTKLHDYAKAHTLAVCRITEFQDAEQMQNGTVMPVVFDLLFVSGVDKGQVLKGERQIGKGITGTLRAGNAVGDDVVVRMEIGKRGATEYVMFQVPSDPEFAAVEKLYTKGDPFARATVKERVPASSGGARDELVDRLVRPRRSRGPPQRAYCPRGHGRELYGHPRKGLAAEVNVRPRRCA